MKIAVTLLALLLLAQLASAKIYPTDLKCEYQKQPLAVEETSPLLSWELKGIGRSEKQTAYRILVASDIQQLRLEKGNLWDSGKVVSSEQNQIPYAGTPLTPFQKCYWMVATWDKNDKFSGWSTPEQWTMGLMGSINQTPAHFIQYTQITTTDFSKLEWFWYPGELFTDPGSVMLRKTVKDVPANIVKATWFISADNRFTAYINSKNVGSGDSYKKFYALDVTSQFSEKKPSIVSLAILATNDGSQKNEAGVIANLCIVTSDEKKLSYPLDTTWKVSNKKDDNWLDVNTENSENWVTPTSRGKYGCHPWGNINTVSGQMPIFRKTFTVNGDVQSAMAYICGLGQHELSLNGEKVGDNFLDPGWTNYKETSLYVAHDITSNLKAGENTVGIMLGNGMYNVRGGRYIKFSGSFGEPQTICLIRIQYTDGSIQTIGTDQTWQTALGPITFSCTYGGEDYDAQLEIPDWNKPSCIYNNWETPILSEKHSKHLTAQYAPPIKVMQRFTPIQVTQPKPGIFVVDLGQNFSGFPTINATGTASAQIKLWPGEILNADGTVTQGQSGAPMYYAYTFKDNAPVTWSPRFTYYGSRYIQIEGAGAVQIPGLMPITSTAANKPQVTINSLVGNFSYASAERTGLFQTSSTLLNKIDKLICMAINSNFQSVLTDCPHREKLGWLEQTHLMANGLIANYDLIRHYTKILKDASEAQTDKGLITDIAPEYVIFSPDFRDSPEWGSAFILDAWYTWLHYGNTRLIHQHCDAMKKYIAYLSSKKDKNGMISHGLGDWYDVGPGASGYAQLTAKELTATATYYQNLQAMILFAKLLNRTSELEEFTKEAESIKELFNKRLFKSEQGFYDRDSQTANAMPLVVGLVEDKNKESVLKHLLASIDATKNQITSGDVGFSYLVKALVDSNNGELLFKMVTLDKGPGYVNMLKSGCTTLHESWKVERTSSFNHFMLGHANDWFYRGIGGIRPSESGPGYAEFTLKPQVVGDLSWANVRYHSIRGNIKSHWISEEDSLTYDVTIPANTIATIYLPTTFEFVSDVLESGKPLKDSPDIELIASDPQNNYLILKVGSGDYHFQTTYKR